jgi:hypothetical protein
LPCRSIKNAAHAAKKEVNKMKIGKLMAAFTTIAVISLIGCASKPKVKVDELENKGTSIGVATPDWIKNYTANGITSVQSQPQYKDKYCVIGEESGVNKQFVLAWADNFSAQQRIGAMLRTNIASEYQARVQGAAQSQGGATTSAGANSGEYRQEIDNVINSIVNVSYSGAQREADWWSLRRRYDPDQKGQYSDEYTAYVLYTIPKGELNRQVSEAMITAARADSALYDITVQMARDILQSGMASWLEPSSPAPAAAGSTAQPTQAATTAGLKNGTYTLDPRPRARQAGGTWEDMWIVKVEVESSFITFYFDDRATGAGSGSHNNRQDWYPDNQVTLYNLDNPNAFVKASGITDDYRLRSLIFPHLNAKRFRLESTRYGRDKAFDEIIMPDEPDK